MRALTTIPGIVAVLSATGATGGLWRAWAAIRARRGPAASTPGSSGLAGEERLLARLVVLTELVWTTFFLVHFVFLATLAESKEVAPLLSAVASAVAGLSLLGGLGSLIAGIRGDRQR